jgi:hypothetical protein
MKNPLSSAVVVSVMCLILPVLSGCASPPIMFSAAAVDPARFPPVDPLDEMIRHRAKLSIAQVVAAVVAHTNLSDFEVTRVDVMSIRADFDANRNVVWKVEVRTRGKKVNREVSVRTYEVDDNTSTLRPREGEALELLKALEPYLAK